MKSAIDISENNLMLLSTVDLDEVLEAVAAIVMQIVDVRAVAVLIWDADLETFSNQYISGPRKRDFKKFVEAYAEQSCEDATAGGKKVSEVDPDDIDVRLAAELLPVFCYRVENSEKRCASILIAGASDADDKTIDDQLTSYPLVQAISNAWEVHELRRENERLRARYEELEDQNCMLQEQTRQLIHDTMHKSAVETQLAQKERLVYSISNAVRSSLKIQEVLETAVNKIGDQFKLSRCVLFRPLNSGEELSVFEYCHNSVQPCRDLFLSDSAKDFVQMSMRTSVPHDFSEPETDTQDVFDREFLLALKIRSGLLVPIIIRDRNIGSIFLQDCLAPRDWSIDATALIGSLADQLAVGIENAELHKEKEHQAVTDGLTGIANRRHFNDTFAKEFERAKRYGEPLSLIVVDLDFLKKINDTYGHQVGDAAIQTIGRVLGSSCRANDLPARYGGEEFCLLLPNTDVEMASNTAERLRKLINETPVDGPGTISASIGVANFPLHASEPDALFEAADEALYCAKESGRNRVCISSNLSE